MTHSQLDLLSLSIRSDSVYALGLIFCFPSGELEMNLEIE